MSTRWNPAIELSPREERLCRKLEKHRRFFRFLRLHRSELFGDGFQDQLLALYSDTPRGTAPKPPAQLMLVVLLQAYTGASDDDAVQLAEVDARWQMVLDCHGVEESPFKKSTLVDFRARLVRSGLYPTLLRRTAELARRSKDFDPRQLEALRVAVDSLPLDGVGRVEDTLNLLARALRLLVAVIATVVLLPVEEVYAAAGPRVLAAPSPKTGLDRDWDEPGATEDALNDLMQEVNRVRIWMRSLPAEALQRRHIVAAQTQLERLIEQDTDAKPSGGHRIKQEVAPDRQLSLFDPEMRHGRKSKSQRIDGYKVYLAHDLDADVTLATAVQPANTPEMHGADKLREAVCAQGTVAELHIDRAFLNSQWAITMAEARLESVVCRPPATPSTDYFSKREFEVDFERQVVQCPAGQTAPIEPVGDQARARFGAAVCRPCARRPECQNAAGPPGRSVIIVRQEALLRRATADSKTVEGRARLRERVGVEHVNAHHARYYGKTARYRGVTKNDFDAARISAVNNLQSMDRKLRVPHAAEQKVAA